MHAHRQERIVEHRLTPMGQGRIQQHIKQHMYQQMQALRFSVTHNCLPKH